MNLWPFRSRAERETDALLERLARRAHELEARYTELRRLCLEHHYRRVARAAELVALREALARAHHARLVETRAGREGSDAPRVLANCLADATRTDDLEALPELESALRAVGAEILELRRVRETALLRLRVAQVRGAAQRGPEGSVGELDRQLQDHALELEHRAARRDRRRVA